MKTILKINWYTFPLVFALLMGVLWSCSLQTGAPLTFAVVMNAGEVVPASGSLGSGNASLVINSGTGVVSGSVTLTGFTPIAVHLHAGYSGDNGEPILTLEASTTDAQLYEVPAGSRFNIAQLGAMLNGGVYVSAHSAALPDGEVRGQLLPVGVSVVSVNLTGKKVKPSNNTSKATATAKITLNENGLKVAGNVLIQGMTATGVHVHTGAVNDVGPELTSLVQDPSNPNFWRLASKKYSAENFGLLSGNGTYIDVHSATYPDGEIRGQI